MKKLGWILGVLYLVDGLIALLGGRKAVRWFDAVAGKRMPSRISGLVKEASKADKRIFSVWGVNNLIAGLGMLAVVASLCKCFVRRTTEEQEVGV